MELELARKRPAEIVRARPLGLTATERPIERPAAPERHRTPADWPARIWVPICTVPGAVLGWVLVHLAEYIGHAL